MGEFFYPLIGWFVPFSTFLLDFPGLVVASVAVGCCAFYFGRMQKADYAKRAGKIRFALTTALFLALSVLLAASIFWLLGIWAALVGSNPTAMGSAMLDSLAPIAAIAFCTFFLWLVMNKYAEDI